MQLIIRAPVEPQVPVIAAILATLDPGNKGDAGIDIAAAQAAPTFIIVQPFSPRQSINAFPFSFFLQGLQLSEPPDFFSPKKSKKFIGLFKT